MQRLEVSCAVGLTYTSLGAKGLTETYVVGSKIFRPDIQKPRQMENAVRDI